MLHHATNIVQVLREAKRVLKPGGRFVAIREPVWPLVAPEIPGEDAAEAGGHGVNERFYTLSDYKEFFDRRAADGRETGEPLRGFQILSKPDGHGFTHARYAFIA